ncbi:hypothetical protein ACFYQA_27655 [Streptomyces sp. NPDC005774]
MLDKFCGRDGGPTTEQALPEPRKRARRRETSLTALIDGTPPG